MLKPVSLHSNHVSMIPASLQMHQKYKRTACCSPVPWYQERAHLEASMTPHNTGYSLQLSLLLIILTNPLHAAIKKVFILLLNNMIILKRNRIQINYNVQQLSINITLLQTSLLPLSSPHYRGTLFGLFLFSKDSPWGGFPFFISVVIWCIGIIVIHACISCCIYNIPYFLLKDGESTSSVQIISRSGQVWNRDVIKKHPIISLNSQPHSKGTMGLFNTGKGIIFQIMSLFYFVFFFFFLPRHLLSRIQGGLQNIHSQNLQYICCGRILRLARSCVLRK